MPLLCIRYSKMEYSFAVSLISFPSLTAIFFSVSRVRGPAEMVLSTLSTPLRLIITRILADSSSRAKGFVR